MAMGPPLSAFLPTDVQSIRTHSRIRVTLQPVFAVPVRSGDAGFTRLQSAYEGSGVGPVGRTGFLPGSDEVGGDADALVEAIALADAVADTGGIADAVSDGMSARDDEAVDSAATDVDGKLSFRTFSEQLASPIDKIHAMLAR